MADLLKVPKKIGQTILKPFSDAFSGTAQPQTNGAPSGEISDPKYAGEYYDAHKDWYNDVGQAPERKTKAQKEMEQDAEDAAFFNNPYNTQLYTQYRQLLEGKSTMEIFMNKELSQYSKFCSEYMKRYSRYYGRAGINKTGALDNDRNVNLLHGQYDYEAMSGMSDDDIYKMFMNLGNSWYGPGYAQSTGATKTNGDLVTQMVNKYLNLGMGNDFYEKSVLPASSEDKGPSDPDTFLVKDSNGNDVTIENVRDYFTNYAREYYANAAFKEWLMEMLQTGKVEAFARKTGGTDIEQAKAVYAGIDDTMQSIKKDMDTLYKHYRFKVNELLGTAGNQNGTAVTSPDSIDMLKPSSQTTGLRTDKYDYGSDEWHKGMDWSKGNSYGYNRK